MSYSKEFGRRFYTSLSVWVKEFSLTDFNASFLENFRREPLRIEKALSLDLFFNSAKVVDFVFEMYVQKAREVRLPATTEADLRFRGINNKAEF